MASQPPDTGRDRNQVRPLRSTVSSVRGKANRHRSTGVSGSHFVLDCGGSREQAARFQDLLQQPSHPYLNGRANAESACVTTNRKSPFVSMATSLSILISDTSGCVIFRFSEDSRSLRYPVNLGKTSNSIIWCLRSWLLRASRIRSFHSNRINSPETGAGATRTWPKSYRNARNKTASKSFILRVHDVLMTNKYSRSAAETIVELSSKCPQRS